MLVSAVVPEKLPGQKGVTKKMMMMIFWHFRFRHLLKITLT